VEGASGRAPSTGTLEDMLRKSLDTGISLHGVPFPSEGNLVCFGGSHIPGTLIVERRRALVLGHLCEGFHEWDLGGGLLYCRTRTMRFLKDTQNVL
jgi:hypothetical protein